MGLGGSKVNYTSVVCLVEFSYRSSHHVYYQDQRKTNPLMTWLQFGLGLNLQVRLYYV